jgi:AhpD family alkylhydroperoxidase
MNTRLDLKQQTPEAYGIMLNFEKYLSKIELTSAHKNLIKIRASQLNGCSYCVDMHTKEARAEGETEQRLYVLSSWKDTPYFSEQEKAILAVTEEVTLIQNRLSEATYQHAVKVLGERHLAQVMIAIIVINAWNRIGVATEMMPA